MTSFESIDGESKRCSALFTGCSPTSLGRNLERAWGQVVCSAVTAPPQRNGRYEFYHHTAYTKAIAAWKHGGWYVLASPARMAGSYSSVCRVKSTGIIHTVADCGKAWDEVRLEMPPATTLSELLLVRRCHDRLNLWCCDEVDVPAKCQVVVSRCLRARGRC